MVKFAQMLFCDRNNSSRIVDQSRNIRLHGNTGLFPVRAVSARDDAACAQFREPLSGERCAEKGETFRRFVIASKYACKITASPVLVVPKMGTTTLGGEARLQYMR